MRAPSTAPRTATLPRLPPGDPQPGHDPHSSRPRTGIPVPPTTSASPHSESLHPRVINRARHVNTWSGLNFVTPDLSWRNGAHTPPDRPPPPSTAAGRGPPRNQIRLPAPSCCQPQRSARPSTSSSPRPLVSSPSACRWRGGRPLASTTSTRTVPTTAPDPEKHIRSSAAAPVCTTALVTSSEISRISVSARGSSAPIPDPTSRDRAHRRARPTSAGSGRTSNCT